MGPILLGTMKHLPGLQAVSSDQQNGGLDELMNYDRVTAAKLGITVQSLDSALYGAFGQSEVSVIYTQSNQYYVVLEVAPQYWQSPEGLKDIYLITSGGTNIPLLAVAKSQTTTTPLAINHTGLFPSVTVSFNLASNVSLSDATSSINQMQQQLGAPSTLLGFFSGTLQAYQQSLGTEPLLIVTALLAVYIVLGILYESLVHPLTIISTQPSASVGAMPLALETGMGYELRRPLGSTNRSWIASCGRRPNCYCGARRFGARREQRNQPRVRSWAGYSTNAVSA